MFPNKVQEDCCAALDFLDEYEHRVHDLRRPFQWEPDYNVTSVNYDFAGLRREKHWREKA